MSTHHGFKITGSTKVGFFEGCHGTIAFRCGDPDWTLWARVFPDGTVETHQGYTPERVAELFWRNVGRDHDYVSLFPGADGALVTIHPGGPPALAYRKGYTPSPTAKALWEALAAGW